MNSYIIKYRDGVERIEHTAEGHVLEAENGMAILSDDDGAVTFAVPLDRLLSIAREENTTAEPVSSADPPASPPFDLVEAGITAREAPVGWENRHLLQANVPDGLKNRIMNAGFEWEQIVPNTIVLTVPLEQSDPRRKVSFALQDAEGGILASRRGFEYDATTSPQYVWVTPNPVKSAIVAAGYDWDRVKAETIETRRDGQGEISGVTFAYLEEQFRTVEIS